MSQITVWGGSGASGVGVESSNPGRAVIPPPWLIPGPGPEDPIPGGPEDPVDPGINQPVITFPNATDNENIAETDTATSSIFAVNDGSGRTHLASRWQIVYLGESEDGTGDPYNPASNVVYDSGRDTVNKTSLPFTGMLFEHESWYAIRVRYQANDGAWGAWSENQSFITIGCLLATWNPADKTANTTLSENDTRATFINATCAVRSIQSMPPNTGKYYWEFYVAGGYSGGLAFMPGVHVQSAGVDFGVSPLGQSSGVMNLGNRQNDGGNVGAYMGPILDKTVNFAYDSDNDLWWAGIDGVWVGDPEAGTGGIALSATAVGTTLHAAAVNSNGNIFATAVVIRSGVGHCLYDKPAGFKFLGGT